MRVFEVEFASGRHVIPDSVDLLEQEEAGGAQGALGLGQAHLGVLLAGERAFDAARRLRGGEVVQCLLGATREAESDGGEADREDVGGAEAVEGAGHLRLLEGDAAVRDEEVRHGVGVAASAAQAADLPDIGELDVLDGKEHCDLALRSGRIEHRFAAFVDDGGVVGAGPDGVADAAGEGPASGEAVAAGDFERCLGAVAPGDVHIALAKDLAQAFRRHVARDATNAGVLRDAPGYAGVGASDFSDDLGELAERQLGAADRARNEHAIEPCVLECHDEGKRQVAFSLNLVGGSGNLRRQGAGGFEQGLAGVGSGIQIRLHCHCGVRSP